MPNWKQEIRNRLAGLNVSGSSELEIIEELSLHLEERYQELLSQGKNPKAAYHIVMNEASENEVLAAELNRLKRRDTNGPVVSKPNRGDMISDLIQDLRFGFRALVKSPSFTVVAILTLAIGIGANTVMFSLVNPLLIHPLPYKNADRLVVALINNTAKGYDGYSVSPATLEDWRKQS